MSFIFELGVESYELLLSRCDPSSREYQVLLNACIEERGLQKVVQILCQREEAEKLLVLALAVAPAAADIIKSVLDPL